MCPIVSFLRSFFSAEQIQNRRQTNSRHCQTYILQSEAFLDPNPQNEDVKTLEAVGPNGASVSYLHQRLKDLDIQVSWASGSARNCIASTLTHDNAFARLGPAHGNPGHYTLDELKPEEPESKREYPQSELREEERHDPVR